jgi:hypothetical protein
VPGELEAHGPPRSDREELRLAVEKAERWSPIKLARCNERWCVGSGDFYEDGRTMLVMRDTLPEALHALDEAMTR